MQVVEKNPLFTNLLVDAPSLYLRQHAHNPVFWYPWGKEAMDRARKENKPIFLSIGYSSCYWCHVMEREVFENPSIAATMNEHFINIKVDREEFPQLDEIYMTARQLLRGEGGWPNNVFLTPDLRPFYAGGTYSAEDMPRRPSFPKLLEWVHYTWTTTPEEVTRVATKLTEDMKPHLVFAQPVKTQVTLGDQADKIFGYLKQNFDSRAGGFFQAPKFPNENYLQFLLGYYEFSGRTEALDMVTFSLAKMAAGGLQDQVGCGFHRYAIDKEWYIPHFEKMLYNQALLARLYTDVVQITGNAWFGDIAKSILDFVGGPLTSGNGGFYSAIDAETEGVEGAHYAWSSEELKAVLTPNELAFLTRFYALADIPKFPGHKHVDGQVLVARAPLDLAAREHNMPYVQLAAMVGELMNKLLAIRSKRQPPALDDKILVGWNGLMIDAFAHAAKVFKRASYTARAREAADFILENAIDNNGNLKHVFAAGSAYLDATLEDYVFLIKGLISLWRVTPDDELLDSAKSLAARVEELFADKGQGYFFTTSSDELLVRIKSGTDATLPNANAIHMHNLSDLHEITQDASYLERAKALREYFITGNGSVVVDSAIMMHASLRLGIMTGEKAALLPPSTFYPSAIQNMASEAVAVSAEFKPAKPKSGSECKLLITLDIKNGWYINANQVLQPYQIPTQIDVEGAQLLETQYPEAVMHTGASEDEKLLHFEGKIVVTALIKLPAGKRTPVNVKIRYQACQGVNCYPANELILSV